MAQCVCLSQTYTHAVCMCRSIPVGDVFERGQKCHRELGKNQLLRAAGVAQRDFTNRLHQVGAVMDR